MNNAQLIQQSSGRVEFYTPSFICEAAARAMGGLDLDPASCEFANTNFVHAERFFTKEIDGLSMSWECASLFCNPPFGRKENPVWVAKFLEEVAARRVPQACYLTYACTSEEWFQPLLKHPQCFLCPRTNYHGEDGNLIVGVPKGSVVTYLGPNEMKFRREFEKLGTVKV